jgi:hypothetical protein
MMKLSRLLPFVAALAFSAYAAPANKPAKKPAAKASKINEADTWDLTTIYKSEADWKAAMEKIKARLPMLDECRGHLDDSA